MRRALAGTLAAALALALSACSPSTPAGTDWTYDPFASSTQAGAVRATPAADTSNDTEIPRGSGTVVVAHLPGWVLPDTFARAFHEASGYTIEQRVVTDEAPLPSGTDLLLGIDAATAVHLAANGASAAHQLPTLPDASAALALPDAPHALAWGRNDVCVYADRQWFSANNRALPASLSDLATPDHARLLAIPSSASSEYGRTFRALATQTLGDQLGEWEKNLSERGASTLPEEQALGAWSASPALSEAPQGTRNRPLLVWGAQIAARAVTNTGTDTYAQAVPGTCARNTVYALVARDAAHADGAHSLMTYLISPQGQRALAASGTAYPLTEAADTTPAHWFMTPREDAVTLTR